MTHLIRNRVFETNSSSCHSITISNNDVFEGLTPNEDNEIVITPGEFGWEEDTHWDAMTKIAYCWQDTEGTPAHRDMLTKVVLEHTGASVLRMKSLDCKYHPEGYIDHQSQGTSYEAFESEYRLKQFLFNSDSELITDNDNH